MLEKATKGKGVMMQFTPAAMARVHSLFQSAWQAMCTATIEDEQAVSTARFGPCRSQV